MEQWMSTPFPYLTLAVLAILLGKALSRMIR